MNARQRSNANGAAMRRREAKLWAGVVVLWAMLLTLGLTLAWAWGPVG